MEHLEHVAYFLETQTMSLGTICFCFRHLWKNIAARIHWAEENYPGDFLEKGFSGSLVNNWTPGIIENAQTTIEIIIYVLCTVHIDKIIFQKFVIQEGIYLQNIQIKTRDIMRYNCNGFFQRWSRYMCRSSNFKEIINSKHQLIMEAYEPLNNTATIDGASNSNRKIINAFSCSLDNINDDKMIFPLFTPCLSS